MKHLTYIFFFVLLFFQSCYKEPVFTDFQYETYNRIVGPEGGTINFYGNYENDTKNTILVSMNVPAGALDSMLVFNMYQYEDYELVLQMTDGFAKIGSKFMYFVPFYESEGYNERGQLDLSYHLSINFNEPISVTYHFLADAKELSVENWQEAELYHDNYKLTNQSYQLFRIKIPKLDEWGEYNNIFVNWNRQGYPDGYDRTDLSYIVSGLWSQLNDYGTGTQNLENWELVDNFELNTTDNYVTFNIYSTDYIYVLAQIIYLEPAEVPLKIQSSIEKKYPLLKILRAAFDGESYQVYLSDNSYASYTKNGDFIKLINDRLSYSDLPALALDYINANYPNTQVKKVILTESENSKKYETLLSSGIKLFFDESGYLTGSFQYGFDPSDLPTEALNYLSQNHISEVITNVTFNNEELYNPQYIVYLSSDAKVYFDAGGFWNKTLYYRIKKDQLPEKILSYFSENYPNTAFSGINHTIWPNGSSYAVSLVDSKWFQFDENSDLIGREFLAIDEKDLPPAISTYISTNFSTKHISKISFHSYAYSSELNGPDEGYDIYFDDLLTLAFNPAGELQELYGNNKSHLPNNFRTFMASNYPNDTIAFCSFRIDGSFAYFGYDQVLVRWEMLFSDGGYLGLGENNLFAYRTIYDPSLSDLLSPIASYIQNNYPGLTVYESSKYFSAYYGNQIAYFVVLSDYTSLVFNESGGFIEEIIYKKKNTSKKSIRQQKISKKRLEIINMLKENSSENKY
ncbi:MAG: PepSY-like domain-containing protein [Bacteroidales bacterium]|nr:PepSY-like domain-containing protein [Bacteroidales bacterium]